MKNFRKFSFGLFVLLAVFFVPGFINNNITSAAVANITKIVFTTEPQTVAPGVISTIITVQTQNSGGAAEQVDETSDLAVSVTSPTGQFNSNNTTWNPATTFTMSKNTANKNFYYKDSSSGTFTITAKITTRTTGKSWTATQNITVGNSSGGDNGGGSDGGTGTTTASSTDSTDNSGDNGGSNNGTYTSTHYAEEDLSNYAEPASSFEVSAGRNRLSYVGSPVSFNAKRKTSADLQYTNCTYLWSFGDGISLPGEKVEHVYKYAGDYNVILNGTCGSLQSVSRTTVKVVEPNLSISGKADGSVEIANQGKYEINLFGWRLQSQGWAYVFPLDTIISAGKSVVFPAEYLKISASGGEMVLVDVSNKVVGQANQKVLAVSPDKAISVADFQKFALVYKNYISPSSNYQAVVNNPNISAQTEPNIPLTASVASAVIITTSTDDQVEDSPSQVSTKAPARSFWDKLFHPIRTIQETFYN